MVAVMGVVVVTVGWLRCPLSMMSIIPIVAMSVSVEVVAVMSMARNWISLCSR